MRKDIGDQNKRAREEAVRVLVSLRGTNVKSLKNNEITEVLLALLQLLGLADPDGKIK